MTRPGVVSSRMVSEACLTLLKLWRAITPDRAKTASTRPKPVISFWFTLRFFMGSLLGASLRVGWGRRAGPAAVVWGAATPGLERHRRGRGQNQQQLAAQLEHAFDQFTPQVLQGLWQGLGQVWRHGQHVADVVHQQVDGAIVAAQDHVHGQHARRPRSQAQPLPKVQGGDDLSAQVDEAADDGGGQRHPRHLLITQHLLHRAHLDAEQDADHREGRELDALHGYCSIPAGATSWPDKRKRPASVRSMTSRSSTSVTLRWMTAQPRTPLAVRPWAGFFRSRCSSTASMILRSTSPTLRLPAPCTTSCRGPSSCQLPPPVPISASTSSKGSTSPRYCTTR